MARRLLLAAVAVAGSCALTASAGAQESSELLKEVQELRAMVQDLKTQILHQQEIIKGLTGGLIVVHPFVHQPMLESRAIFYDQFGRQRVFREHGQMIPVDIEYNQAPPRRMEIWNGTSLSYGPVIRPRDDADTDTPRR